MGLIFVKLGVIFLLTFGVFHFLMTLKKFSKQLLPLSIYYIFRDVYASAKDSWKYVLIRREYTNFSILKNLAGSLKMLFKPEKTILCYPDRPSTYHVFYKMCALCSYKISINPEKKCDAVFWSHNITFPDRAAIQPFSNRGKKVINSNCINLGKKLVGRSFEQVFGYSLDIDPATYKGSIVEKSVYNGTNFATALKGPIPFQDIRENYVYQKEIDNRSEFDDLTVVYRVPVYLGEIPIVYLKYRPYAVQFTGTYTKVEVKKPRDLFTEEELSNILEMNKKMGIDYGECDVLRDTDGKIYVVDVNSNPGGPPVKMSHQQKVESGKLLVPLFKKMIEHFS